MVPSLLPLRNPAADFLPSLKIGDPHGLWYAMARADKDERQTRFERDEVPWRDEDWGGGA